MQTQKQILTTTVVACAFLTGSASAFGADIDRSDYVGHRLPVKVDQALFYNSVPGSFTGSLQRGQTFKVDRLSPSGKYAYGFAYGGVNRHVYVKTAGLNAEASSASKGTGGPQLVGTPSVRYVFTQTKTAGRALSLDAVFRTDEALKPQMYGAFAAPTLRNGQRIPDDDFGGITPGVIGRKSKHCYYGEITQARARHTLGGDRTWRMGFFRQTHITQGRLKHVTLKPEPNSEDWKRRAARRLGC